MEVHETYFRIPRIISFYSLKVILSKMYTYSIHVLITKKCFRSYQEFLQIIKIETRVYEARCTQKMKFSENVRATMLKKLQCFKHGILNVNEYQLAKRSGASNHFPFKVILQALI